jgi:hypothetical protein
VGTFCRLRPSTGWQPLKTLVGAAGFEPTTPSPPDWLETGFQGFQLAPCSAYLHDNMQLPISSGFRWTQAVSFSVAPFWPLLYKGATLSHLQLGPSMAKLTARFLEAVKSDGSQDTLIPDEATPCLYFVIVKGGAKSWMVRYVARDGARRKLRLGRFPALGLADARVQARAILVARDQGADPATDKKVQKERARHARTKVPR